MPTKKQAAKVTTTDATKGKSLFEIFYEGLDAVKKTLAAPFVRNAVERKFAAKKDALLAHIDELNNKVFEEMQNVADLTQFDIDAIVEAELDIKTANESLVVLEKLEKKLFAKGAVHNSVDSK